MKFRELVILIIIGVLVSLAVIDATTKGKLPKIKLPHSAHNTIGEIPIIEHYDDGDLGGKPGYKSYDQEWIAVPSNEFDVFKSKLNQKDRDELNFKDSGDGYVWISPTSWDKHRKSGAICTFDFSYATTAKYLPNVLKNKQAEEELVVHDKCGRIVESKYGSKRVEYTGALVSGGYDC